MSVLEVGNLIKERGGGGKKKVQKDHIREENIKLNAEMGGSLYLKYGVADTILPSSMDPDANL